MGLDGTGVSNVKPYIKRLLPERALEWTYRWVTRPLYKLRWLMAHGSTDIFDVIYLETITACNRRCAYCPNATSENGRLENAKRMPADLYKAIIDELAAAGWKGDLQPHFYGEPLLDERLAEWVAYAKRKLPAARVSLFSNGDYLTVATYDALVKAGVTRFIITQHSAAPQQNVEDVLVHARGNAGVEFAYKRLDVIWNRGGAVKVDHSHRRPSRCLWAPPTVGVDCEGNVLMCCHDYYRSHPMGSVRSESLLGVWNKPAYRRLRQQLRKGEYTLEICRKCTVAEVPERS